MATKSKDDKTTQALLMLHDHDVVKINALIEAFYMPMSLWESRIFHLCLSQIRSKKDLDHNKTFHVSASTLSIITNTSVRSVYSKIRQAAEKLQGFGVSVRFMPNGKPVSGTKRDISVVAQCDYIDKEGRIELQFTHSFIPYVSSINSTYTNYQTIWIIRFRSLYAVRIYELCLQHQIYGKRDIELSEFRRLLGIDSKGNVDEKKKYKRIESLKSRVIFPAIADINRFSDMRIFYSQRKAGRNVTHVIFKFELLDERKIKARLDAFLGVNKDYLLHLDLDDDNSMPRSLADHLYNRMKMLKKYKQPESEPESAEEDTQ